MGYIAEPATKRDFRHISGFGLRLTKSGVGRQQTQTGQMANERDAFFLQQLLQVAG